ncbi:PhnA domain-containing protein [Taibaiella helva]|uniref:PhnA domain-containing protein n=1 Tax=Taibaiella helva TaxID=2301235 RepID=UPI000E56FCF4|nr:alkylphosphonate utilization protein [Taibaiella helva]
MNTRITDLLRQRCNGTCELCATENATIAYAVSPKNNDSTNNEVAICTTCLSSLDDAGSAQHWQCLAGSIWNTEPSVQALSYRILYRYKDQEWASDIIGSVELDEAVASWALSAYQVKEVHRDSNGNELLNGDTVVLTQGLNVKGANFMAPKGTIVRRIRLVPDNTDQIEGKINEQTIVILTKYVRKS